MQQIDTLEYPIKYGILGKKKINDSYSKTLTDITSFDDIEVFIVSRCFLISEIKNYISKNEVKTSYKVVFPCESKNNINGEIIIPIIDNEDEYINYKLTPFIFDKYEDASQMVDNLNDKLKKIYQNNYEQILKEAKEFENQILERTLYLNNKVKTKLKVKSGV